MVTNWLFGYENCSIVLPFYACDRLYQTGCTAYTDGMTIAILIKPLIIFLLYGGLYLLERSMPESRLKRIIFFDLRHPKLRGQKEPVQPERLDKH